MKNYLYLMFVAALFVTSCTKEEQTENLVKAPSIVASQENNPNTKTLLAVNEGVGTIYWQPAEDINVFFGTTSVKYTSTNTENVTTAAFETSTIIGSSEGSSTNIWGLYPFSSEAVCNGSKVTTTIPSAQYGVPETFDKNVFTTLAHSTTKELQFLNVCGGIKFSLSRADITKITFEGNNGETLAGKVDLTFVDDVPAATSVTAATKIILTPKTGSTFAKDVNYYIITLPVSMIGGFTMTFETATQIGTFNYTTKAVTVSRSKFSKKDNIDTYALFEEKHNEPRNNEIFYTSNNGLIVSPYNYFDEEEYCWKTVDFGSDLISNEYVNGIGVLTFASDIHAIPEKAFFGRVGLCSIHLPKTIENIGGYAFYNCVNLRQIVCDAILEPSLGDEVFSSVRRNGKLICSNGIIYQNWLSTESGRLGKYEWNERRAFVNTPLVGTYYENNMLLYRSEVKQTLNTILPENKDMYGNPIYMTIKDHTFYSGGLGVIQFDNNTNTLGRILQNSDAKAVQMSPSFTCNNKSGWYFSSPEYYLGSKVERVNIGGKSNSNMLGYSNLSYNQTIGSDRCLVLKSLVVYDGCGVQLWNVDKVSIDRIFLFDPGAPIIYTPASYIPLDLNQVPVIQKNMEVYYRRTAGFSKEDYEGEEFSSWKSMFRYENNAKVIFKPMPEDIDKTKLNEAYKTCFGYYVIAKAGETMKITVKFGDEYCLTDYYGYIGDVGINEWFHHSGDDIESTDSYTFVNDYEGWVSFISTSNGGPRQPLSGVTVIGSSNTEGGSLESCFIYRDGVLKISSIW